MMAIYDKFMMAMGCSLCSTGNLIILCAGQYTTSPSLFTGLKASIPQWKYTHGHCLLHYETACANPCK